MFNHNTPSTPKIEQMLIENLTSWKQHNVKNEQEAFAYFYQSSGYLLKMFWQCRFDKMNMDDKSLNLWISENYLPQVYKFDRNKIHEPQLNNLDIGHDELVASVLHEIWNDYLNSDMENLIKPPKGKVSLFKKLL